MKKALLGIMVFITTAIIGVAAHAEDTVQSTFVQSYGDTTYTCTDTFTVAEKVSSDVKGLPGSTVNEGFIYRFAIYYDKIYYLTGEQGTSDVIGSIYRCNIDGTANELLVNDAEISDFWLSDGCLYYTVFRDWDNYYGRNLNGGIMKVNLNTGAYGRIVTDSDAYLINVLGDKLFYYCYENDVYCMMNSNGAYLGMISYSDVEVYSDRIANGGAYIGLDNNIYSMDCNGSTRWIGTTPDTVNGYEVYENSCWVENVTGGYIYYTIEFWNPSLSYRTVPNTALYRMPVGGGNSTLVSMWYIS